MYQTKFDAKMKQNYMTNMIMNVSGTLCQLIHYFPGKQWLAINLTWPALKSKQRTCIKHLQLISVDSHLVIIWGYYKIHNK